MLLVELLIFQQQLSSTLYPLPLLTSGAEEQQHHRLAMFLVVLEE